MAIRGAELGAARRPPPPWYVNPPLEVALSICCLILILTAPQYYSR